MTREELNLLESLVDQYTLAEIVSALSAIAIEKSLHIAENWNDVSLERSWKRCGVILDKAESKIIAEGR